MSTRSVIAIPTGPNTWHGKYVHSDGYPTGMVKVLRALVERDGLDKVIQTVITDSGGWSYLRPRQADFDKVTVVADAVWDTYEYGTPEGDKFEFQQSYGDADRFMNAPGYGVAYTLSQAGRNPWFDSKTGADSDVAFAYVLFDTHIDCYSNSGMSRTATWEHQGALSWTAVEGDTDLTAAECGKDFENCDHVASFHLPADQAPDGGRMSMQYWLGRKDNDLTFSQATQVELANGMRYNLTGSYGMETSKTGRNHDYRSNRPRPYLFASVRTLPGDKDSIIDFYIGRRLVKGLRLDVGLVFPPTRERGERTYAPGTFIQ